MKDIVDRELIDELPVHLRGFRLLFQGSIPRVRYSPTKASLPLCCRDKCFMFSMFVIFSMYGVPSYDNLLC